MQLKAISEYGIGFSDAASHIALPLIIALFAFAFPFLFTVISHINNKYKAESITKMLSSEASYGWFMGGAIFCASFLFVTGLMSICLKGDSNSTFKVVLNWSSVFLAGAYSAIIIWFVYTCIKYNRPRRVLGRIGSLFETKSKSLFNNTIKAEKRIYGEENNRINRYIELCKYAVNIQDYKLFVDILKVIKGLKHKRKNLEGLNFTFFEEVLDSYLFGKPNGMMEESLVTYWFNTFKKNEVPNVGIVNRMLAKIVTAVQQGRLSLFERYLLASKTGYRFIGYLPIISYVRGDDLDGQNKVDNDRIRAWLDLREVHNLALAHLFSLGYYDVIRIINLGDNKGYDRLIPGTGIEVLKLFAICKEKQNPDGSFGHLYSEHVIGKNTDSMMLEKYAAIMLLLSSNKKHEELRPISPQKLKYIKEARDSIVRFGTLWKADSGLKGMFPQIADVDIQKLTDEYIKWLEGHDETEEVAGKKEPKKCVIAKIVDGLLNKDKSLKKKQNVKKPSDIYNKPLLESEKEKLETAYWNMISGNRGYILDYLYGNDSKDKTETKEMGPYSFRMFKQQLVETQDRDYNLEVFGETRIYMSRYMYILLRAIQNMRVKDVEVQRDEVARYLRRLLDKQGEKYVIVDLTASYLFLLSLDRKETGEMGLNKNKVFNAAYKDYNFDYGWFLYDLEELEPYKDTIVIIKRTDLPYVCSSASEFGPKVEFEDQSDKDEGIADVRVTVNPNFLIKYSKKAIITRVKVLRNY